MINTDTVRQNLDYVTCGLGETTYVNVMME